MVAIAENGESLLGLVRVLAKGSPAPWAKVEQIVRMCPRLPEELTDNSRPPATFQLSAGAQDAVLAVARFVVLSGGQYATQLVPVVLKYLHALPYMSCISRARRSRYATKRFGRLLISYCIRIANRTQDVAHLLVEETLYSLEQSLSLVWSNKDAPESFSSAPGGPGALQAASAADLSYNAIATLAGFLKALGEGRFESLSEQQIGQFTALVTVMISDEKLRGLLSEFERRELEEEGAEGVAEDLVNELAHLDAHRDEAVPLYVPQGANGELVPLPDTSRSLVFGPPGSEGSGAAGALGGSYAIVPGGPRGSPPNGSPFKRRTTTAQAVEAEFPPLPRPSLLDSGYLLRPLLLRTMVQITQSLELAGPMVQHAEQFTLAFFDAAMKALADLGLAADEESRRRGHIPDSPGGLPAALTPGPAHRGAHPAVVLLTDAARLAVRCAVLVPSLKPRVVAFCSEALKDMAGASQLHLARILEHASSPEIAEFYSRALRNAAELAARYPDVALALADTLRGVLTAPILNDPRAVGLLLREDPNLRDEIIRTVCVILKTCVREARRTGGPRAAEQLSGAVSSLIYSVFNQLGAEAGPSERLQLNHSTENFILLVGRIATTTAEARIVESLVPYLLECFYRPGAQQLHGPVLDQLAAIALLGHEVPYREAVDLMEKLYKNPFDEKHKTAIAKIPQCLQALASGLTSEKLRADLRRRILMLFNSLGADISSRSAQSGFGQANAMAGALGALLPALAESLEEGDEKSILHAEAAEVKAFRSVWFYSVLYGFVNEGQWLPEWHQALRRVADRSPVLVTRKSSNYLETEISIQNMLTKSAATEKTLGDMLKMLGHLSPNAAASGRINFAQATYVLSVFHLERMRVLHGGRRLYCIFAYLEDAGIELLAGTGTNANDTAKFLMECIVGLADQVIVTFMAAMEAMGPTQERQAILEQQMVILLTNLCNRVPRARTAAERFTHWVIQKFPQVLFVGRTWRTLLSLLEVVGNSCERSAGSVATYLLPWSEGELNLPEELHDRANMLQNLSRLCTQWLTFAFTVAPAETQTLLQEYLQSFRSLSLGLLGHFGSSVVVEAGAQRNAAAGKGAGQAAPAAQGSVMGAGGAAGQFVASLELKAYNAGEISGMRHIFADVAKHFNAMRAERSLGVPRLPFGPTVGRHLVAGFMEVLERHQDGALVDFAEFDSLMYRASAFLIADAEERQAAGGGPDEEEAPEGVPLDSPLPTSRENGYREQLLHLICWAPVYLFSPQTIQTGVFAWGWIAASLPESDTRLLSEICGAWGWSVEQHLGLFSHYAPPADYSLPPDQQPGGGEPQHDEEADEEEMHLELPSLARRFYRSTQRKRRAGKAGGEGPQNLFDPSAHHVPYPRAHDIRPHRAWVDFLMERFEVVRYRSPQQIKIMAAMIHKSLANPASLSKAPQAIGPRFKLLLLALRVANYSNVADRAGLALLRHRVYNATLTWFLCAPSYYDPGNNKELEADERTLIDFCKYIRAESQNNAGAVLPRPSSSGPDGKGSEVADSGMRLQRIESALNFTALLAPPAAEPAGKPMSPSRSTGSKGFASGIASAIQGALPHGDLNNMRRISATPVSIAPPPAASAKRFSGMSDSSVPGSSSLRDNLPDSGALLVEMAGSFERRRQLILLLVGHEIDRISAWRNPQNRASMQLKDERTFTAERTLAPQQWSEMLKTAWQAAPRLAVHLALRFPTAPVRTELEAYIKARPDLVTSVPEAIPFLATEANVAANIPQLRYLLYWCRSPLTTALAFLGKTFQGNPLVLHYALNTMRSFPPEAVVFYLPQICQSIRHDHTGMVRAWLLEMCQRSDKFAHQLIWALRTESEVDEAKRAKGVQDRLPEMVKELDKRIVDEFSDHARRIYREEFDFFNGINAISGILKPLDEAARKPKIIEELKKFAVSGGLYLPTNPDSRVVGIVYESASPMQSAAKVPILVAFLIRDEAAAAAAAAAGRETPRRTPEPHPMLEGAPGSPNTRGSFSLARKSVDVDAATAAQATGGSPQKHPLESRPGYGRKRHVGQQRTISTAEGVPMEGVRAQACIFKVGDDCRQDCLALQFIRLFKNIFQTVGLNLYLYPYRVVTTSPGCGIIECVPRAKSRDMVGKMSEGSLYEYFLLKYGHKDSLGFQKARRNFILSMAGYSVVSFILQIKDRHNGNILVDEEGHVIHIDFGFIFDISPGGDLKFERAPFKLSAEMIQIMGGGPQAEPFNFFVDMCCKAFLACRQHMESFLTLAELMKESGLPAYRPMTMQNLRNRFVPDKSERQASAFMAEKITESYDKFSTMVYDEFQAWANGIER